MILLYCFDLDERIYLHGFFRDKGIRIEAVPPSDFCQRSYYPDTDVILIAGKTPYGFLCEINPDVPIISIAKYPLGNSINFRSHDDPGLAQLLASFSDADTSFDCNGVLYTNGNNVLYLGYLLDLTETERAILAFIASERERTLSAIEIAEVCMGNVHGKAATVAKHISSINAKAKVIGGRQIIRSPEHHCFKLNDYI